MPSRWSRRRVLQSMSAAVPLALLDQAAAQQTTAGVPSLVADVYPSQPLELMREMVTVAHFDLKRVRELGDARPALAKAAVDWGFGDFEDALGAASHVGNRPIAEYLISKGARPTLFSATMLGQLEVVKAFVAAQPGVQRIRGPHSIPLLAHAKAGGERAKPVLDFLQTLGDADSDAKIPLPEADAALIAGTYVFGIAASQQVDVTVSPAAGVQWARKGMVGRGLFHLGSRTFHPMGAEAVRIRFAEENGGVTMTVHDPDVVLTAKKRVAQ